MSEKDTTIKRKSWVDKFLSIIEKTGNALPHPATLFAIAALLVIFLSWVVSLFDLSVTLNAGTPSEKVFFVENLMSKKGLDRILKEMVTNFTNFAPLGTVLVALLGIGIAEGSGLIGSALKLLVLKSPPRLLTLVIVFAGVISNTASEVGYVLLVPLAALIFKSAGRHPIAGLAAAFAGVSGGYSANLLLGTIDPLLSGLSEEAAKIIDPGYTVNAACNYYFMAVSTFLITFLGTWVTEKIVVPRLGKYEGDLTVSDELKSMSASEKRGLRFANIALLLIILIMVYGVLYPWTIPGAGFLRDGVTNGLLKSPFMQGIVAIIFLSAAIMGIAYGIGAKTFKNDFDVMKGMSKSMETLGSYIVLVFFAAQFVAYFNWTNLGMVVAVNGAEGLKASGLGPIPLLISFMVIAALINLVMGSASAKWAIMAPVFIPMFMLNGYSPELTQVAYRIGDSVTNIISPMMSYFALIIAFVQQYDKKAGMGTVISTMIPYSIAFFVGWVLLFVVWYLLGLPIGPDAPLEYISTN